MASLTPPGAPHPWHRPAKKRGEQRKKSSRIRMLRRCIGCPVGRVFASQLGAPHHRASQRGCTALQHGCVASQHGGAASAARRTSGDSDSHPSGGPSGRAHGLPQSGAQSERCDTTRAHRLPTLYTTCVPQHGRRLNWLHRWLTRCAALRNRAARDGKQRATEARRGAGLTLPGVL
jgi:hypothetical protein